MVCIPAPACLIVAVRRYRNRRRLRLGWVLFWYFCCDCLLFLAFAVVLVAKRWSTIRHHTCFLVDHRHIHYRRHYGSLGWDDGSRLRSRSPLSWVLPIAIVLFFV